MNIGKYIFGVDEAYLADYEEKAIRRQIFIYNLLSLMLITLVILVFIAGTSYGIIIFGNWLISIFVGIVFAAISFVILLLIFFLNMTTQNVYLYEMMTNMESTFDKNHSNDLVNITDQQIIEIVNNHKESIISESDNEESSSFHLSNIATSTLKVFLIIIISLITANGVELFLFKNKINDSIEIIKNSEQLNGALKKQKSNSPTSIENSVSNSAEWTMAMLTEDESHPFYIVNSHSIILSLNIMDMTIGDKKMFIDLFFSILFLTPFILIKKSKEFSEGEYQKEVAIQHICTSLLFFLLSQRESQRVKKNIAEEYDYEKELKIKYSIT